MTGSHEKRPLGALYAFAGSRHPNGTQLVASAVLAGFRGTRAHGWVTPRQEPHQCLGQMGLDCELGLLATRRRRLLGWASDAGPAQPARGWGMWLVQAGVVYGAEDPALIMLASVAGQGTGDLYRDLTRGLADLDMRDRYSAIVMGDDGTVVACRMQLPLYVTSRDEGEYMTSFLLTPDSRLIPEVEPYLLGGPDGNRHQR